MSVALAASATTPRSGQQNTVTRSFSRGVKRCPTTGNASATVRFISTGSCVNPGASSVPFPASPRRSLALPIATQRATHPSESDRQRTLSPVRVRVLPPTTRAQPAQQQKETGVAHQRLTATSVAATSAAAATAALTRKTPTLGALGCDLTQKAASGALDPLIGRQAQVEQMIQALARRRKNNPVLVGEPGVGKTAVVEGLAQKIAEGDVPDVVRDKRIIQLDVASLLAGTKNRGEFEERMKKVVDEVLASEKQIILFIDEIHTIVGAGGSGNGGNTVDAAAILKPTLARGDIQCIGATTSQEYHRHIEKDPSLERRFQPITVEQTRDFETVEILKGLAQKYEAHHKVQYSEEALLACVNLAADHIPDRFMPDKAIDVFDEVGAFVQLRHQASLAKAQKQEQRTFSELQVEKELAIKAEDYKAAAELKLLQVALSEDHRTSSAHSEGSEGKHVPVTEEDVAQVVSKMTGIPLEKLSQDGAMRMLNLEREISSRIVGQNEAVVAVSRALRRARVGLKNSKRPIASFLFCGPTGVGKTELCKALSEAYFGRADAMIRLDMSEFMELHSVSKLIGSPPGYIGYGDVNQLTDRIRRKPHSLILFDEVEKAHTDVLNLMLQMMDDGCLTDATGRNVSFKNALIVMTSNACARTSELSRNFSPEFLNRLDEIIPFSPLTKPEIESIADLEFEKTIDRVKAKGVSLTLSESFKSKVIHDGFDVAYGARPLRRSVVRMLDDELANSLLRQPFDNGEHVHVDIGATPRHRVVVLRADGHVAQSDRKNGETPPEMSREASTVDDEAGLDVESITDSEFAVEGAWGEHKYGFNPYSESPQIGSCTSDTDSSKEALMRSIPKSANMPLPTFADPSKRVSKFGLSDLYAGVDI